MAYNRSALEPTNQQLTYKILRVRSTKSPYIVLSSKLLTTLIWKLSPVFPVMRTPVTSPPATTALKHHEYNISASCEAHLRSAETIRRDVYVGDDEVSDGTYGRQCRCQRQREGEESRQRHFKQGGGETERRSPQRLGKDP